jgi:hypothetical protein
MKSLTLALIFSFSIAAESKLESFKLEVYQTDLSIYNSCLVIGKNLNTNMMVAIVEDRMDCFYTRKALRENIITIYEKSLAPLSESTLKEDLLSQNSQIILMESTEE